MSPAVPPLLRGVSASGRGWTGAPGRYPRRRSPFRTTTTVLPSWPTTPNASRSPVTSTTVTRTRDHAEREDEVLGDHPACLTAERDGVGEPGEIVAHQHEVGGLHRRVGAGRAHRDPDGRGRQRRRVVHAVADHRDGARLLERLDGPDLVLRQQIASGVIEAELPGDGIDGLAWSPDSTIRRLIPSALSAATAAAACGRTVSASAMMPREPRVAHQNRRLCPRRGGVASSTWAQSRYRHPSSVRNPRSRPAQAVPRPCRARRVP